MVAGQTRVGQRRVQSKLPGPADKILGSRFSILDWVSVSGFSYGTLTANPTANTAITTLKICGTSCDLLLDTSNCV
jgi:hypothetical protein